MVDDNLLDDRNIESELPNAVLTELQGMGRWLLLTATFSVVLAVILFLISMGGVFMLSLNGVLFLILLTIFWASLLMFAFYQFRCSKAVNWIDQNFTSYTLGDLYQWNSKAWRAFTFVLLSLVVVVFLFFFFTLSSDESISSEPMDVPSVEPEVSSSSSGDTFPID